MNEKNSATIVNDLVEVCRDAEKGFYDAAKDVREQRLKEMFLAQSRQMGQFGKSLQDKVSELGGEPRKQGSVAGTLHRTWMDLRAALNRHDSRLVLVECNRGEAAVLSHYERALEGVLPKDVKEIVEKQFVEILLTRNRLQEMEHSGDEPSTKKYNPLSTE